MTLDTTVTVMTIHLVAMAVMGCQAMVEEEEQEVEEAMVAVEDWEEQGAMEVLVVVV